MSTDAMNKAATELKKRIAHYAPESRLTLLSVDERLKLKSDYPCLPNDYFEYLENIGYGPVGKMSFSIYSGPVETDEIFDQQTADEISHILLFGDDYSGWMFGYDTTMDPWEMRLLNHAEILPVEDNDPLTFTEFIHNEFCRAYELAK